LYAYHIGRLKYYLEKGDNNLSAWFVRSDKILGKVVAISGNSEIPPSPKIINGRNIFLETIIFGLYRKIF